MYEQYKKNINETIEQLRPIGLDKPIVNAIKQSYLNAIDVMIDQDENTIRHLEYFYKVGDIKIKGMIEILKSNRLHYDEQRNLIENHDY